MMTNSTKCFWKNHQNWTRDSKSYESRSEFRSTFRNVWALSYINIDCYNSWTIRPILIRFIPKLNGSTSSFLKCVTNNMNFLLKNTLKFNCTKKNLSNDRFSVSEHFFKHDRRHYPSFDPSIFQNGSQTIFRKKIEFYCVVGLCNDDEMCAANYHLFTINPFECIDFNCSIFISFVFVSVISGFSRIPSGFSVISSLVIKSIMFNIVIRYLERNFFLY